MNLSHRHEVPVRIALTALAPPLDLTALKQKPALPVDLLLATARTVYGLSELLLGTTGPPLSIKNSKTSPSVVIGIVLPSRVAYAKTDTRD